MEDQLREYFMGRADRMWMIGFLFFFQKNCAMVSNGVDTMWFLCSALNVKTM